MRQKKDVNIQIGANLQAARERAGYTQETLSEMIGITPNHLSAIERGISGVSLENLQKLCLVLGISADYALFGTAPDDEVLILARQLAAVPPRYRERIYRILIELLDLTQQHNT